MTTVSWERVRAAFLKLGCLVYKNDDYNVYMNRGPRRAVVIRKLSPVTKSRQRALVAQLELGMDDYLVALAGTGPPISDD